jgi:hypothetical protein
MGFEEDSKDQVRYAFDWLRGDDPVVRCKIFTASRFDRKTCVFDKTLM